MPFQDPTPKSFTREAILALPAGLMGVYGIFKKDTWIYIGRGDIRAELLRYLGGENPCIVREQPTSFVMEVTPNHVQRELELLLEISTSCNERVG